jgi:hypothetical protein
MSSALALSSLPPTLSTSAFVAALQASVWNGAVFNGLATFGAPALGRLVVLAEEGAALGVPELVLSQPAKKTAANSIVA